MSKLGLEEFNNTLFGALNDPEAKLELYNIELKLAVDLLEGEVFMVMDELEAAGYKSEHFEKATNIKNNIEDMLKKMGELEKEIKRKEAEGNPYQE